MYRKLDAEATRLLRANGFSANGQPKAEIAPRQREFERKLILTSGVPRRYTRRFPPRRAT